MMCVFLHDAALLYRLFALVDSSRQSTKEETSSQTTLSMDRKSPPRNNACQQQQNITDPMASQNFETTFDVDGNIETRSTSSQGNNKEDSRSQRSVGSGSKDGNRYLSWRKNAEHSRARVIGVQWH